MLHAVQSAVIVRVTFFIKYAGIEELKARIETRNCSVFRALVRSIAQVGSGVDGIGLLWRTGRY